MGKNMKVDVAVIGAGTAGLVAVSEIAKVTQNFVLIQDGPMGTTCARVGCMPSKALIQTADDFHRRAFLADKGISGAQGLRVDGAAVMRHVRTMRDHFAGGMVEKTTRYGERLLQGHARFVDIAKLDVEGTRIEAKTIIIANGSRPRMKPEWAALGERVLTSDELFEIEELPKSLAVIGMGVIGTEMGQALARLGVEVVGVARSGRIAGLSDARITKAAAEALEQDLELWSGHAADIRAQGDRLVVTAGANEKCVDAALVSTGRVPNIDNLGLETLGIAMDESGIPVHDPDTLQVGNLPLFIAGDTSGREPILHEAWDDGRVAGYNATRANRAGFKRRACLHITFSEPNIVMAGRHFKELEPSSFVAGRCVFQDQGRAMIRNQNRGLLHVYVDAGNGRLLGAEMCAPDGEHVGHLLAWAIQQGMSVFDALKMPFYHPVIEEGLRDALKHAASRVKAKPDFPEMAFCEKQ
jgi:dihydrolipoamide dehydrogenase